MSASHFDSVSLPLTASQTTMWLAQKFMPETEFSLAEAIEIHGPLDVGLMQAALWQLTREAEALRVRFVEAGDSPRQMISAIGTRATSHSSTSAPNRTRGRPPAFG